MIEIVQSPPVTLTSSLKCLLQDKHGGTVETQAYVINQRGKDQLVHASLPASRFATRISLLKSLFALTLHLASQSIVRAIHEASIVHSTDLSAIVCSRFNPRSIHPTKAQTLYPPSQWTVFLFPSSASSVVWPIHVFFIVSHSDHEKVPTRTLVTAKSSALPSGLPVPLSLQYGACSYPQCSSILTKIQVVCWPASLFCGCCATETGKK